MRDSSSEDEFWAKMRRNAEDGDEDGDTLDEDGLEGGREGQGEKCKSAKHREEVRGATQFRGECCTKR